MTEAKGMAHLRTAMGTTAEGWGAVIDGVLDIRTVSPGQNAAAMNALYVSGIMVGTNCRDPDCDCMVKAAQKLAPKIRVVRVRVEIEGRADG